MSSFGDMSALSLWLLLPVGAMLAWPAVRLLAIALRALRFGPGRCQICGFSLDQTRRSPCPECGTPLADASRRLSIASRVSAAALTLLLLLPLCAGIAGLGRWAVDSAPFGKHFPDTQLLIQIERGDSNAIVRALGVAATRTVSPHTLHAMLREELRFTDDDSTPITPPYTSSTRDLPRVPLVRSIPGLSTVALGDVVSTNLDTVLKELIRLRSARPPTCCLAIDMVIAQIANDGRPTRVWGSTTTFPAAAGGRSFTDEQAALLVDFILSRTRDHQHAFSVYWGATFEALSLRGKTTPQQTADYIAHAADPILHVVDETVYAGEPVPMAILPGWHVGSNVPFTCTFVPDESCAAYLRRTGSQDYAFARTPVLYVFTPPATPGPFTISGTLTLTFGGPPADGKMHFSDDSTAQFWFKAPRQTITRHLSTTCTIVVDDKTPKH